MRNSRTKTQTKLRNYIKLTAGALLLAITFVLVFAGTLSGAFGIEENLQQNGIIENNVASAAVDIYKNPIQVDFSNNPTTTSIDVGTAYPNYYDNRSQFCDTDEPHTSNCTWNATTWGIGNNSYHTAPRYAHVAFDFDLGADWKKYSDSISFSLTGTVSKGAKQISGYLFAIISSDTKYGNLAKGDLDTIKDDSNVSFNGTVGGGGSEKTYSNNKNGTEYRQFTGALSIAHKVKGRYVRVFFGTWDGSTQDYGNVTVKNVSLTISRTLKTYSVAYDKNASDSTGTVSNTTHKFMAASNISSNFYVGNRQYFTEWNTSADGNGVRMAIGASTGTSTAANTFGSIVKTNLEANNTTTTLYAQYVGISFVFNRQSYSIYNNEVLQVLQGKSGYLTHTVDSSYTTTITYKNSSNSTIPEPTSIGVYSATITVTKDGKTRGSVTLPFEIIEGDFGKIQGGTGKWGSVTNPYVISNETHLKNLSAIVNGRDALNSIVGSNNNSVTAEDVVATDKTYKDCYFVVAADLGADTPIALVSIGKDNTHYFAGTIFGGNDSDATNRTQRTIYLNVSQSGVDNVGLFGYVKGATISHLTTAGTIVGGAAVGGLVGYADGVTISNCRNNASISGKSFIGGIVGKATNATINASHNTNTIQGSSTNVGGILGGSDTADNNILITSCYNTAKISGIDNVGGITGRFAKNGDKDVKISNCYNLGEVFGTADSIGGIVGFSENGCVVEYCYNKAKITGSYALGGIVGSIRNGGSISILYCYADFTDEQKQLNATNPNSATGGVAGGIVSGCFAGTNTANITVENSWAIYNYSSVKYTDCKKQFDCITDFAVAPLFFDGTNYVDKTWTDILTVNINAFQILGRTESGKFLALHDGSNKSTLPNKTVIGKEKNSTGSLAKTDLVVNFIVYYNADTKQNVVAELKDIKIDAAAVDYNATEQYVVDNTQLPTTVNTHYFKQSFYFDQNGGGNATLGKTNASTYKVYSDVWIRANNTDYLVGRKESTWTIKKLKFTIGNNQFFYGQDIENAIKNQIVIKNQSNVSVPKGAYTVVFGFNDTEHNFYGSIDIDQNQKEFSVAKTIISIYDSSNTLINDNFDINGFSVIVKAGDFGVQNNGINKSNIENNPWGSESNPYIIGTRGQLVTLSNIVRGVTNATNSQYTSDVYKYVKGTIASYGGAYFKLARSLTSIGNITPIGTSSNVFAATFDGNNNNLSGLNISVAGNNVGLFGYISGATIKNLTVNGSVKGSSNVGGVVGYALNSTIENVTNNASVNADYTDISYTIRQVDATPVSGGDKNYPSGENAYQINDGNVGTKYCGTKKAPMSFIAEINNVQSIVGFAIQNATDTSGNPQRTPKKVTIWGSNNGNEIPSESWGQSGGGNKPTSWSGYTSWVEIYTSDDIKLQSTDNRKNIEFDSTHTYRYYWVYIEGTDKQLQFAEFDFLSPRDNIGGVVGYASDTTITTIANNGSVSGSKNVGGIVGEFNSLGKSVSGATNSGAITSSNTAAGIVGKLTEGSISGSKNTGRVTASVATTIGEKTGAFLGGIAGWANGNVNNCYNSATVTTETSWGNSNIVGGIVGFLVNGKTVSYCYNSGTIVGSSQIGGIIGYLPGARTTVTYCYHSGRINSVWNENNVAKGSLGYITGNDTSVLDSCWILPGASTDSASSTKIKTNGRKLEVGQYRYVPAIIDDYSTYGWTDILTKNINGFRVQESVNPGASQFFESKKGSNSTTHLTPNKTESSNQANALIRDNTDSFTITAWYGANTASDIYCAVNTIAIDISADTYNNAQLGFTRSDVTTPGTSGSVYGIVFDYKGKNHNEIFVCAFDSNGNIVAGSTNPTQVDTYNTTVFVKIGDIVVGKKIAVDYTIDKAALNVGWEWTDKLHANLYDRTGNGDKVQFVYNGKAQGLDSVSEHLRDVQLFDVTGNDLTNTNAATYTRTYTLKDTRNYKLQNANNNNADLSGTTVTFEWKIRKNKLTVFNRWVAEDFGKDSNLYTFEYNTTHRGLLATNDAITFLTEKATDNTRPEFKQGTDYTISEHQNAINVDEYSRTVRIINTNYEVNNTTAYVGSSNNATVNKGISVNGLVVTYTWKIVPYSLATNITSGNVWFGGRTDLIVGNQGIANVNVGNQSYADKRFYPLQSEQNGVQKVLVYAQHNYAADKFVLYVKYNNGTVAVLTQGTEYTLSALDAPTVENPTPLNTSVTASGTGNFSGNITKWYTALFSDFGWKDGKTPEDNDWGGSADNPYVISKPEHLLRLSQIVNGGTAWNSIQNTVTAGVCIAPQTTAKATSRDYKDAYFLVTVDIDMSGYISTDGVYNFLPIGTRSTQNQTELPFSATFDGGDNTITYVYNVGSFYNVDGARKNYVGLFGYLNGATISNLKVASNGGLSITDNDGIVGIEYVGGIAGYAVDSTLYNSVLAYGGWVGGENYVGGIVGYGERITIVSSKAVSLANVGGETYVGGIVGKWIVSNQNQIGGSVAGQINITPASQNDVMGIKYVGGIAGWMDTSSCATTISYAPQLNNNGNEENLIVVGGIEYVGALFGVLIGNGYHQNATNDKYTAIVIDKDASDNFKVGNVKVLLQNLNEQSASGNAKVVGGLVGYAEGVGILFNTDWTTSNVTLDTGNYPSFIGGIAGVLGKNATIEAIYQLKNDGTFLTGGTHTITHSVPDEQKTFGTAAKPLGSFVGGIVGYVSSQAGVYWETGTTIFGNGISLVNLATIYATSYAGGIFGALGDLSTSVAQTFENDTNSILYNVLTTGVRSGNASTTLGLAPTVSGNGITAQGRLVNNASISVSGSYVGGIAGYGGAKVRFVLRNTPQDSAIDVSKLNIYSGGSDIFINGSYAGGIAGYLVDNLEHDLQYIVVKARFNTNNQSATRVGGLVGYMGSGNVQNCVVTNGGSSAITASTDTYQGSEYVGGLVGETQNATIRNSVSTGFNLEKTSNTKGGLLGYGANPTIDSSWTFYIAKKRTNFAKNATPNGAYYATVSQSPYGKYILVDEGLINATEASYPTFASLCGFVGLLTNANVEGTLEFDVKVPNKTLDSNYENTQLAFYNASGSDTVTDNVDSFSKFENKNNTLTIALDMASGNSMQICVVGIEFVNVPQKNDTDTDKTTVVEGTYRKPSNSDKYIVHVTTANFNSERQITKIVATVYFECNDNLSVVIGSAYDDKRNIGGYDESFTPGSSATTPYTISTQEEWNDFAYSVYGGRTYIDANGNRQYVKLLVDVTVGSGYSSFANNSNYNFAGDVSKDSNENNFRGVFDGNGHTITVSFSGIKQDRASVFPNASGAIFRNLTIAGTICSNTATSDTDYAGKWNAGYDVAGFVGKPFGDVYFYNCTNRTNVSGLRNAGGFVGYTEHSVYAVACVNKGDIYTSEGINTNSESDYSWVKNQLESGDSDYKYANVTFGTGGIIGNSNLAQTIESCMNTGNISGGHNVGGIIGRANGDLTINNCANVGDILAHSGAEKYGGEDTEAARKFTLNYAGGIVGKTSKNGTINMYASYNKGTITAWGSIVGGLIGSVGNYIFANANLGGSDSTQHKNDALAKIFYCYNTGLVQAAGTYGKTAYPWTTGRLEVWGSVAGGIVGSLAHSEIRYCYNTGEVITHCIIGGNTTWQSRVGGIAGQVLPNENTSEYVLFDSCYNTGLITIDFNGTGTGLGGISYGQGKPRYGAPISGYLGIRNCASQVTATNCFALAYTVRTRNTKRDEDNQKNYTYFREYNKYNSIRLGESDGYIELMQWGTVLDSLADFTAVMNTDGTVKPNSAFGTTHSASVESLTDETKYKAGTALGYVYAPGCLPQLAVFAVDTHNGLSMRSIDYGQNIYREYREQKTGEEYSPYVIRDGIDLLGVQTLVDLGYTFENEYIEFANGKNNITLDKVNSSVVSSAIDMPTSDSPTTKLPSNTTAYKSKGTSGNYTQTGKSYHLFSNSAICGTAPRVGVKSGQIEGGTTEGANTAYTTWLERAYYYDGAYNYINDMANTATFKVQNMLSIGRNGNVFKGSISGKQEDNDNPDKPVNTVINNLRIMTGKTNGGAYAGLFGHIEDAYVGYIEVGGESNIWSFSYNNSDISVAGGVVAYMTGGSVVEHCVLSGTASVGAFGKADNTTITSDITFAGGIVGLADTKQGDTYNAGIVGTIKDCIIDITTANNTYSGIISGSKSNIGGVLGYVGGDAGASGKGNSVRIEGCEVQKAAIQAASSANTSSQIGGILGFGSEFVAAFITGCKVGVGGTVSIKGEHSLGGIAGGMSNAKGGYIDSCIVGANTTIERINQGGDKDDKGNDKVSENPDHGTAIGGFVGFTEKSTNTTSPLTTTFSGKSSFLGKIKVTVGTTNPGEHGDKKPVDNVGGIVGDMGSGANFASGSEVEVRGNINVTLEAANVGGVAGRTNTATFIGNFVVKPNMQTDKAENVGGFIGKNVGTVYILADTTERIVNDTLNGTSISIGGKIKGTSEVGGFIGVNNSGSTLNIGSNVANAKPYKSGTLSITIAAGAEISGSGDNVGGIVGKNEGAVDAAQKDYATIDIVKGTIVQNGTISGKNYVGGIIGLNAGLLTTGGGEADTSIGGIALSDDQIGLIKNLSITNIGNVTGSGNYVGGVVGKLDSPATLRTEDLGKGAIAGTFTNSGTVVGNSFVGGSLGFVGKNVTITAKNNVATLFVNEGEFNAKGYFVGGSIGALVGKIQGENSSVAVKFENKKKDNKKVNATGFVGGSIGVLAGPVSYAQFVNSSGNLSIAAVNAVGGSVGFIGVPTPLETILTGVGITLADDYVKVENTHFEASGELTANPDSNAISVAKDAATNKSTGWGGVGGAIGVIGKNVRWGTEQNKNTYYANGNVTANGINNVGGIVGIILAENVNISNMLAYNTTVKGGENVGGIVGATDGIGTVITSAYAIEGTFTGSKNVGGIIGLAKPDTDASTSYWVKGYANSDIATYDVKDLSKLGFTTGKATTGWFFLYANDATVANGLGTINTNHQGGGEIELKYWKRIANAYTAQERADGDDKKTIAPPSNIVSGGQPQHATLYATATAAEVTEKGYYMYTATSNNDVKPSVIYDNGVYYISVKTNVINAEDEKVQAQNVAVFYRSVSSSKEALIYNGYLRNAIIGLDGVDLYENPIGDNETPTINGYKGQYIFTATTTIKNADGSTSEVNEAQSDPNTYSSVIKIYYVDDNGTARLVGGNTELAWKITERELTVKFEKVTNRVYGTGADNSTDMTITISNIAPNRGKSVPIKITVAVDKEDIVVYTWNGTSFTGSNVGVKLAYLLEPNGTLSDEDKSSTSENITDENTYQLVARLFFTEAKSYTITVSDGSSGNTKARYVFKVNEGSAATEVSDNFTVIPAELKLVSSYATSSAYDGTYKGKEWLVTGFKYNDGILQFAEFGPSFNIKYKNGDVTTKAMTADNMTTGVDFNGPRVSVAGPSNGNLTISLANAINKGEYYLTFGKIAAGNYTLKIEDYLFSIVEIQIEISCDDNGKSKIYDGNAKDVKFTFKASAPAGVTFDGISEYKTFISKFFKINNQTIETNSLKLVDNKTITLTLQTEQDAATYKFVFGKGEKYDDHIKNCALKPATLPTYTYTITKRSITLSTTPTSTKTYIYNTEHQGLSQVKLNGESGDVGIVSGDTVMVKVSVPGGDPSSKTLSFDNQTLEVTAGISTIDANQYVASFDLDDASSKKNYTLSATNVSWKIDKYKIMIGEFEIGAEKTYNAQAEVPKINVTNSEVSVSGNTFTYGTDTFTLEYAVSYNNQTYASNNLVNAGTYKIKIGTSNGKIHAKHSDGNDASNNYEFGNSSTEHQYVINPCEIKIGWEKKTFVYNASNWKLNVASIEINNKTKTVTNNRVQTGLGNDTLTFSRGGGGIDVGSYTTEVTSHSVSVSVEPIHGVRPIAGNYKIVSGATSDKFSITPSKLKIFYVGGTTTKVYDAGFGISGTPFEFRTESQNQGADGTSTLFTISYVYTDKNVGDNKEVAFTYVFKQNANYEYVGTGTESQNKGQITPAHIKVALDKLRSGKATRTFTNEPYYGGKDGASGNVNSKVYRSGEGFTVSGVLSSDAIKVVAEYREADDSRNGTGNSFDLSSYVNDVVKNKDGTFDMAEAGTHYFKTLVFTMTGTDAKNYTFNVYNKLGTDGKKYSEKDSTAGDKQTVTVYDTDDKANGNANGAEQIKIEITVKSVRVDYGNAYQSYAKADNTYNTNWEPITATSKDITAADGKIDVVNNWMYENNDPTKPKREYHGYTTIRGSEKSTVLGATVSKDKGMNFNFRLINQPVLTIAYIVENNGVYEIDTLARLLIASFYYTAHQNPGDQIFMQIVQSGYKWFEVVNGEDYSQVDFAVPEGSPITVDDTIKTWDAYINALNEKGYVVFYNETEKAWGCYVSDSSQSTSLPSSYKLTKDISGKFTADDIKVLDAFFTVTTTDGNGQFTTTKYTWSGEGSDYLKNVLSAAVDKVATINGSLFVSTAKAEGATAITGFDGTFDGNGYVIEYLNIMGYGKDNVGLFDVIGANGIVKNLHLRNVTINGNAKYVGGIAGKVLAAADALTEKSVKNVSFHGSINVTGSTDQSVGGLFGASERAVENAIVLGSITVSNVNAKVGGVVGSSEQGMSNVVSLMQIDANCNVGAFSQTNRNVTNSYHLQNAVWRRNGSSITFVNHANAKTYDELMLGSNSLYSNGTSASVLGTYDVMDETFADSGQNANPRQSKRLRDMVSVYLLMYSLSVNNGKYTISSSSWLVGTADGTTAKPIAIANKQNVSLLRELRFASFTLKANVSIEIASTFSGAFYGSVTSATNESGTSYGYKITCDKAMFEAYSNDTKAWLSVQ